MKQEATKQSLLHKIQKAIRTMLANQDSGSSAQSNTQMVLLQKIGDGKIFSWNR